MSAVTRAIDTRYQRTDNPRQSVPIFTIGHGRVLGPPPATGKVRHVKLQTRDVFATMRPDLLRVEARVEQAAQVDYPLVSPLVLDIVRAGGKRLRPLVLLLAGRAYHDDLDALVTAAAGVELLHTASLVHDDIVDRAALRRGKPTLNSVLGSGAVILVGDYLDRKSVV